VKGHSCTGARVFFFGGFQATQKDVDSWKGSAAAQRSDVSFESFPWPPSIWHFDDDEHAVKAVKGDGTLAKAITAISAHKDDIVFVVGHSSGCAIAIAVDQGLSYAGNINLVLLDGYRTIGAQRPSTQIWSARNGKHTAWNYPRKGNFQGRLKVWTGRNCTNEWSLHFSLVNTATSDQTVSGHKDLAKGYEGCRANLCWLGPAL